MWRIIKSEISYNRWIALLYFILTPALVIYIYPAKNAPLFLLTMLMFIVSQNYISFRNKQKRERLLAQLPVAYSKIALSRLIIIFSFFFNIALLFLIPAFFMDVNIAGTVYSIITSLCVLMLLFSAYFILRDVFLQKFRDWGIKKERMKVILVILILALNILFVFTFIQARNSGSTPAIGYFILFIENNMPLTWQHGLTEGIGLTLLICGLSIFSFLRRKAYME